MLVWIGLCCTGVSAALGSPAGAGIDRRHSRRYTNRIGSPAGAGIYRSLG